jgi:hypothetical protein
LAEQYANSALETIPYLALRPFRVQRVHERTKRIVVSGYWYRPALFKLFGRLAAGAKVRSLQATSLIDSSGRLVGVVSTQYSDLRTPSPDAFKHIDNLATGFFAETN